MRDIFSDLYNKVLSFFANQGPHDETKAVAMSRLKTVLMQDRVGFSERAMQMLKEELIATISKYMEIDEEKFWLTLKIACQYHDCGKIFTPFQNQILQKLGEIFGKRQMLIYGIMITVISILTTFVLVNQASSSPLLFKTLLEIQNVDSMHYIIYIGLYFITYLVTSFILLAVINTIIKELFVENTIGTYNRLISGILVLALATILLFVPGIFMMV